MVYVRTKENAVDYDFESLLRQMEVSETQLREAYRWEETARREIEETLGRNYVQANNSDTKRIAYKDICPS